MNLELFLMVVAVILAIAAAPVSPVAIITPVVAAQNMTGLNMTAGEMVAGNISGVFTVTG